MAGASPSPDRLSDPARLRALERSRLLDGTPEEPFDRLTRVATRALGVPVALVSLITPERQIIKSAVGLDEPWHTRRETPLSHSFCRNVVADDAPLRIADARLDPRVSGNPALAQLGVVAYAGVPLRDDEGHVLGALCAIDHRPRTWSDEDLALLTDLAGAVGCELRLRATARRAAEAQTYFAETFAAAPIGMGLQTLDRRWSRVNTALCELTGYSEEELLSGHPELIEPPDRDADAREGQRLLEGELDRHSWQTRYRHRSGRTVWAEIRASLVRDPDGAPQHLIVQVQDITQRRQAEAALRASEERFRMAMRHAPVGMAIVLPSTGELLQINRALGEMLGYTERELAGRHLQAVTCADDADLALDGLRRLADGEVSVWRAEKRLRHAAGHPVEVQLSGSVVRGAEGEALYAVVQMEDLTERRRLLAERMRFFDVSMDMLAVIDHDGIYTDLSRAWQRTLGWQREEMLGRHFSELLHPDDVARTVDEFERTMSSPTPTEDFENRVRCRDGSHRWLRWSGSADTDRRVLYMVAKDVTERRAREAELVHLAAHDPLTGLLNRRAFVADLDAHLLRALRYERGGAVLVLDLDDFKEVNDTLGHRAGDELIAGIARVLRSTLRASDVLGRLGGDEFAVLLPEGGQAEATEVAAKLVAAIADYVPVLAGRPRRAVTASIGIAAIADDERPAEDLLAEADLAMYDAKEAGGDRWALSCGEAGATRTRPAWADRIREALRDESFVLHAQPVVDLNTGAVVHHELLLRMLGEDGILIAPAAFLPTAERYDLVQEIDRWVVGRAIDLLAGGRTPEPLTRLEVNISERSLADPVLLDLIDRRLTAGAVDPSRLVLEITEAAAVADVELTSRFADRVSHIGCGLALDDFGAGFGSFYFLEHLAFDFLKIDGEFVATCRTNRTDRLVVDAVVGLARGLGKQTIAEFTPDEPTLDLLRSLGVDLAQGHHIGKPRPLPSMTCV
jgi:diguanylate cyclase (GGDEF)-like protein/PAS domain S-box-containing protein